MSDTVDWPDGFDRTPDAARDPYPHGFQVSEDEALANVAEELSRFDGVETYRVETGLDDPSDRSGSPRRGGSFDPGVVAYWRRDGETFAAPCDRWDNVRDNAQAIYRYLKAKRGMERWGVETLEGEFTTQRVGKVPVEE
jgi:hypothetical protein